MKNLIIALSCVVLCATSFALDLPIAVEDRAVLDRIAELEGVEMVLGAKPGFSARSAVEGLVALGIPKEEIDTFTIHHKESEKYAVSIGHNREGRILSITGNGTWLRNEGVELLAGLPELRMIRIDHNSPATKSDVSRDLYSGAGYSKLADSKLAIIKIGGGFNDDGMKALANIRGLRVVHIGHSAVTDEGAAALATHPNIEDVSFSPMGVPKITNKTLAVLATLPKVKRISMNETFLTYDGGFEHLKPLEGRLEAVTLRWSLVLPADVEKLKADHPGLEVRTSTPAEVADKDYRKRQLLKWASPEAAEYLRSGTL